MMPTPVDRARTLLEQMTLEEKAQQLTAVMPFRLLNTDVPTEQQLSEVLHSGIGHISTLSMLGHLTPPHLVRIVNTIQRYLVEQTRLGIPAIFHLEALNGVVAPGFTAFPTAIGLAASWDPDRVEQMAHLLGRQLRAIGHGQALSPVMDVARDARWGRVHETYGEDPYLVSEMSVAFTRGIQGPSLTEGAMATGKHFLGFAATEAGQHMAATAVSGRELREVYARPFEAAIAAGLASVMNSYSTIDGVPAGASPTILTTLLRDTLGFEGTVVSDYHTIANLYDRQGVASSLTDAARLALQAGLDVELPEATAYGPLLVDAVRDGSIDEALVDRSVLRVLTDKFALGLFDQPYIDEDPTSLTATAQEGTELAGDLARESLVLLKNDGNLLPFDRSVRKIAVIGPHADNVLVGFPGYSYIGALGMSAGAFEGGAVNMAGMEDATSQIPPAAFAAMREQLGAALSDGLDTYARRNYNAVSLTEAIRDLVPDAEVVSAPGCGIRDSEPTDIPAALAAAKGADLIVLALGGRGGWFGDNLTEGEGSDRADINLPSGQIELATAAAALGAPVAAVVFTGRPFALTALEKIVPAIVYPHYGGQDATAAVAEALFGVVNPSGKLPLSLPRHSGQVPIHSGQHLGSGYRRTSTDLHKSYTDMPSTPLYPFGHGLSYTEFAYSELRTSETSVPTNGIITISVTVTNVGARAGTEVVQFYASHKAPGITRPAQELVAFARVELQPGEHRDIQAAFSTAQLAYLSTDDTFVFDPGDIQLGTGSSSADIRAEATITAIGDQASWVGRRPLLADVTVQ